MLCKGCGGFLSFRIEFPAAYSFLSLTPVASGRLAVLCGSFRGKCVLRSAHCVCLRAFRALQVSGDNLLCMCSVICAYVGVRSHRVRIKGFLVSV